MTELRRQERWASVFFTLKDPESGACLAVQMPRGQFDGLRLGLENGERVHVYGRPELYEQRGDFHLRALTIERYGLGAHLAALERLKQKLAGRGPVRRAERKRPLPRIPRLIGLVTGNDAAAKRDVLTAITTRFPPAHVARRRDASCRAAARRAGDRDRDRRPRASAASTSSIIARGGGSFEDLLPFSDERLVRAVAACPVPVVSAVGHEQDTPLARPRRRRARLDARRSPAGSSCPTSPSCARGSTAPTPGLERGARRDLRAARRAARGGPRAAAPGAAARARAPRQRGSRRRTAGCARSRRAPRSTAATRSCAPATGSCATPPPPGTELAVEVAGGAFGARGAKD